MRITGVDFVLEHKIPCLVAPFSSAPDVLGSSVDRTPLQSGDAEINVLSSLDRASDTFEPLWYKNVHDLILKDSSVIHCLPRQAEPLSPPRYVE